jgi:hypothetical protein
METETTTQPLSALNYNTIPEITIRQTTGRDGMPLFVVSFPGHIDAVGRSTAEAALAAGADYYQHCFATDALSDCLDFFLGAARR